MGRAVAVFAILAALLGAPSGVSAAGNTLTAGPPTPATGTTVTLFSLRAAYDGRFEALTVTASVAGRSLPLVLVAGNATSGTWAGTTQLPAGTWPITYTAATAQGSSPRASGGSVTVTEPMTPQPQAAAPAPTAAPQAPAPAPKHPAPQAAAPTAAGAGGSGTSGGTGTGSTGSGTTAASPPPSVNADPVPAAATPAPSEADAAPARSPEASTDTASVTGPSEAPDAPPAAAAPASTASVAEPGPTGSPADAGPFGGPPVGTLVAVMGAVALGLMLVLFAARRRPQLATTAAEARAAGPPPEAGTDNQVQAVLQRRALRRARMRFDDDPIVAAIIESPEAGKSRRERPRQVHRGPGVRERDGR